MFPLLTLLPFVGGALGLIAIPGPDFLYVLGRGMAQGRRAGWLSACGIALGLLVHTSLAVAGLTVLLKTSAAAFGAVKWIGALYLIFIGVKTLRSRAVLQLETARPVNTRAVLWQGFVTNVFNPKAALTFALFLPQFGKTPPQIAALGLMMAGMAWTWFAIVGTFAGNIGAWLRRFPRANDWLRVGAGSLFIALGVRLAFVPR